MGMTLVKAFKQVFGEALAPLGFTKMKGKYPYFFRLIGDEILHVITYENRPMSRQGYKEFRVLGGVATVYRQRINLNISPRDNGGWLNSNLSFYNNSKPYDAPSMFDKLHTVSYNEETVVDAVNYALKMTNEFMLPPLNETTNIDLCIKFFDKFCMHMLFFYFDENYGNNQSGNFYNEWLLYVKTNYRGGFMTQLKNREEYEKEYQRGYKGGNESYEEYYEAVQEYANKRRVHLDLLLDNPDKYAKVTAELNRRKAANTEILKAYGFDL